MLQEYELVVGLEVHIQLNTASKMFCGCGNMAVDAEPNTLTCPVCFGMPGTMPTANRSAIFKTLLFGRALGGKLTELWNFERKNYFYPDLPKGYQITSSTNPPVVGGEVEVFDPISVETILIRLHHIHLEEDAGKLTHGADGYSYVDLNRAGTPLIELVTEPDFRNAQSVKQFLQNLRLLVRALKISDGDMENGHLRCDANVSLKPKGSQNFGVKVEIKNLNSFTMIEKAIKFEFNRQSSILNNEKAVVQETRSWNEDKAMTEGLRHKEGVEDYRYMPEPDVPPIARAKVAEFSDEALNNYLAKLELPTDQLKKLIEYDIDANLANTIIQDGALYKLVIDACRLISQPNKRRLVVAFIYDPIVRFATEHKISLLKLPLSATDIVNIFNDIERGDMTHQLFKSKLPDVLKGAVTLSQLSKEASTNADLNVHELVEGVMKDFATQVADFRLGNQKIYGFLVGQVMTRSKGQADPKKVNELLKKHLDRYGREK